MHLHILGVCGTFMAGIALLARSAGHHVTGSDANVYPPMSCQLAKEGIEVREGYSPVHLKPRPDCVVIGNALSRGNPAIEYTLENRLNYTSGPQWLKDNILLDRWTIAVTGTHGKTTTTAMISWILDQTGHEPGFLIGGVARNFEISARLGSKPFFVIEADEYDTAFFDKRSKFVHYPAQTAVINNIEHDHVDIFPDLNAIQRQFAHFLRIIPQSGRVIAAANDLNIDAVLAKGCWSEIIRFGDTGQYKAINENKNCSKFRVNDEELAADHLVEWSLIGRHNRDNALAAIAAAHHVGVSIADSCKSLRTFKNTKRRLEIIGCPNEITIYDDFAHHPTAISKTLAALRSTVGNARILAILEPRSNTMKLGLHINTLGPSLNDADRIWVLHAPGLNWDLKKIGTNCRKPLIFVKNVESIVEEVALEARSGDHIVIMSNGGFDNIQQKLKSKLI